WIRPVIVLPAAALAGMSPDQFEALLAHELAHIARRDAWMSLLQSLVEAVFFYHPLLWWISARVRGERERCCDDIAVALCGSPVLYAEALLDLEQRRPAGYALAATGSDLAGRIARLLGAGRERRQTRPPLFALLAVVSMLGGLAAVPVPADPPKPPPPAAPDAQQKAQTRAVKKPPPPPPRSICADTDAKYAKWFAEDAHWILRDDERHRWYSIRNSAECDRFIEHFWIGRDKQEHYRRIAYTSERFGEGGTPGWRTERGRIYILYGPPAEVESHPGRGYERWFYKSIPGVGENVSFEFNRAAKPEAEEHAAARLAREVSDAEHLLRLRIALEHELGRIREQEADFRGPAADLGSELAAMERLLRELRTASERRAAPPGVRMQAEEAARDVRDVLLLESELARSRALSETDARIAEIERELKERRQRLGK
ncbi:MAG TPA: GWxTD domain-containing protein, partial [Bryobacteraceae bacterium]|nr:GWxTD domain-containing protein [Bryobacteraceae bacterium]